MLRGETRLLKVPLKTNGFLYYLVLLCFYQMFFPALNRNFLLVSFQPEGLFSSFFPESSLNIQAFSFDSAGMKK